jgi:hypothetical protein
MDRWRIGKGETIHLSIIYFQLVPRGGLKNQVIVILPVRGDWKTKHGS